MQEEKRVLITPLNWGLGHATRMVPIVEKLIKLNARVLIAADKRPFDFLKLRFPEIEIIRLPGFEPHYPDNSLMSLSMAWSLPKMWIQSRKAHKLLQQIIESYRIDLIISDNRYECYSKSTFNVFITHQLQIQTKGLQNVFQSIINKLNHYYIKKYDALWIPDYEDPHKSLAGDLSHIAKFPVKNYRFIGPQSRFSMLKQKLSSSKIDILVILSGPEPQRTLLEELITEQITRLDLSAAIILGKPEKNWNYRSKNIHYISHADDIQLADLIQSAEVIVSRPGYSTIMDLSVFGKKAIFIPTPGQTEQEYLADMMKANRYCYAEKQQIFNLANALSAAKRFSGLPKIKPDDKITSSLDTLLQKV